MMGTSSKRGVWVGAALIAAIVGCSSNDNTPAATAADASTDARAGDASTADAASEASSDSASDAHVRDPSKNCVPPGTKNNDKGVGGYCESTADCFTDAGAAVCTGDVMGTPDDSWFCTTLCSTDADCGAGARCFAAAQGSGCVPLSCLGDGGSADASSDALDQ